ncbi:MAG: aldehyde dehydrogenase family protein [Spirochaetaceae bacterium]|nr:MAG: aldehyde dehydrogenase family protein [Spirochaetaceae bacterium]
MKTFTNYIDGQWVAPSTGAYDENRNPGKPDEVLGMFASSAPADVSAAIDAAARAFGTWSAVPGPERAQILYRFADLLEQNRDELADILSREEGKILKEAHGEVTRARAETLFMAGEASRLTGEHMNSERPGVEVTRTRVPLGPIGVITPWNFPIVTPVRKISPALAYGDTVVFKPATLTPWCAVRLVELYEQAGLPAGVLNLVTGSGGAIGSVISGSPTIRGITFTGSTAVGKKIFRASVENFTKVQLEMGGKNAALVFDAENLSAAADQIVAAAFASSGQRCTAISRVVVGEAEHDELVRLMTARINEISVGDALEAETGIGPLVSAEQVSVMERYIEIAKKESVQIVTGGNRARSATGGYFFEPTLLTQVRPDSALAREEIFGPILSVLKVATFDEAVAVCNDTEYGLAGCVFTRLIANEKKFVQNVEAGMIHVNHGTASQAHVPFGGVKNSGFGAFSIGPTAKDFYTTDKIVYRM